MQKIVKVINRQITEMVLMCPQHTSATNRHTDGISADISSQNGPQFTVALACSDMKCKCVAHCKRTDHHTAVCIIMYTVETNRQQATARPG